MKFSGRVLLVGGLFFGPILFGFNEPTPGSTGGQADRLQSCTRQILAKDASGEFSGWDEIDPAQQALMASAPPQPGLKVEEEDLISDSVLPVLRKIREAERASGLSDSNGAALLYTRNFLQLLFGNAPTGELHGEDRDDIAALRNPIIGLVEASSGGKIPKSILAEAQAIASDYMAEANRLRTQRDLAIAELGKSSYIPSWGDRVISVYVAMDTARRFARSPEEEMSQLLELKAQDSYSYIRLHDAQKGLGVAQDNMITWLRRLMFNLTAFNVSKDRPFTFLNLWEDPLNLHAGGLQQMTAAGHVHPNVYRLLDAHNRALFDSIRHLMGLIVLQEKLPASVEHRIVLKTLIEAIQDLSYEYDPEVPFCKEASEAVDEAAEERVFTRWELNGLVSVNGTEYRERLLMSFRSLLKPLVENEVTRSQLHYFGNGLGKAFYELLLWEQRTEEARIENETIEKAAQAALSSIDRISRPNGSNSIETGSLQTLGWIPDLQVFPEIRELCLDLIEVNGGFHNPFSGEFVALEPGVSPRQLLRRLPAEQKDQIIASQLYSRTRVQAAHRFSRVFFLRAELAGLKKQLSDKKWEQYETIANAGASGALEQGAVNVSEFLGKGSVLAMAMEAARKKAQNLRDEITDSAPILDRVQEAALPKAELLVRALVGVWDEDLLGPSPVNLDGSLRRTQVEGAVIPIAGKDSFTMLSQVLAKLDEAAWKVRQANIEAQRELFKWLKHQVPEADEEELREVAWGAYRTKMDVEYEEQGRLIRKLFWRIHRAVQNAFKEEKPEQAAFQTLVADATLIRDVAPYEALSWLLLKTRSTNQQAFLSELLFHIIRQGYGIERSQIAEANLASVRPGQRRRNTLIGAGIVGASVVVNQGINYFFSDPPVQVVTPPAASAPAPEESTATLPPPKPDEKKQVEN